MVFYFYMNVFFHRLQFLRCDMGICLLKTIKNYIFIRNWRQQSAGFVYNNQRPNTRSIFDYSCTPNNKMQSRWRRPTASAVVVHKRKKYS